VLAAVDPRGAHAKPPALDDEILEAAGRLSTALAAELAVFHAHPPWEAALSANPELRSVPEVVKNDVYSAYCDTIHRQVVELARRHGVPAARVQTLEGEVASTLPIAADEACADIVAIGAVSRSRMRKALIGHTAERVLDSLECDVLVVKPPGFRTSVARQSTHHVDRSAQAPSRVVL
jgi:universal stress protein E